jgi:hypothetical protein
MFSGLESVIFRKDNFAVGSGGIKQLTTGQFVSVIDQNELIVIL